ncbi:MULTISPECIES: branched-chain amino acid transport system II carrier protein [Bacillus]|uniref:Branched-chain amino acid transport system carrier protein n=1 Tax=Bacillus mycoides TaxID=1405 RepID=A0A3D9VKX2_BACMY|nr:MULTISPECIES: branched-chain amino acid transport system II carrier protein [Bacillus]RBP30142.1 LIVCS family branched-chain amino acid:cation transporter [Bacillus sp. DB-2]REF39785.1 LIVCS family branched-chain amino acid:cation transporter [Bacillus mycoides]
MTNKVSFSYILMLGFMLFALFFGAGNLIFPPMLGQMAGNNVWLANAGFLVTGVGLPLLAITAFVFSGKNDIQSLASRVHPLFGIVFTAVLYLAIGPFFAIPRSGNVSFEIGIKPFVSNGASPTILTIFTVVFFFVSFLLSLNPSRIIDIVGKFLTPIKLTFIGLLVVVSVVKPMGRLQSPSEGYNTSYVFFKGFQEGYLTLDALVAFVFGMIIVNAIKERGATTKKQLMTICAKATAIATILLVSIYTALSYMGASSVEKLGHLNNGAEVLAKVSNYYFGSYGAIVLGLLITVACLTTSVGVTISCATFFHGLFPKVSYRKIAIIISVFSTLVANIGLTQLITISVPVLMALYPMVISLIFLTFLHPLFKGNPTVYRVSLLFTFIISVFDGLNSAGLKFVMINEFFDQYLPFYGIGLGWLLPSIIGGLSGYIFSVLRKKNKLNSSEIQLNE